MSQINRTGTFRGYAIDSGMGETKNGYPQWVANLQAVELYDEDTQQWVDWSGYEESEITGYFVLFGGDGNPTLTAKQIQKALGWSGESLQDLNADFSEVPVQFRVEESTYQGETRLKVTWIDNADAEPGRSIQKLDNDDVKKLDAKYAAALRKLGGGPKPKSVPAKPSISKPEMPAPAVDKESAKAALKAEMEKRAARSKAAEAKSKKKPGPKPKTQPPKAVTENPDPEPIETSTLEQAWEAVYAAKPEVMSDDDLGTKWLEVIDKYGDQDTLSPAEWAVVRDEVIAGL